LEKFQIFTAFYHLSELKSRDDLIKGIIENLDYSQYGNFRFPLDDVSDMEIVMVILG